MSRRVRQVVVSRAANKVGQVAGVRWGVAEFNNVLAHEGLPEYPPAVGPPLAGDAECRRWRGGNGPGTWNTKAESEGSPWQEN